MQTKNEDNFPSVPKAKCSGFHSTIQIIDAQLLTSKRLNSITVFSFVFNIFVINMMFQLYQ